MFKLLLAVAVLLSLTLVACSGDGEESTTPPTEPAEGGSPAASPTSVGTGAPPVDGTVAPQNAGDTVPFTIKSNPDPVDKAALLRDVRIGAHPENGGWDRIVFEFQDVRPEGEVRYVTSASQCGSGEAVRLPGEAVLQVNFTATNAHTDAGQPTVKSRQIAGPGNIILESRQICDFEAEVGWAIGLKSRKNFKVTLLQNPTRVVIDVKQ